MGVSHAVITNNYRSTLSLTCILYVATQETVATIFEFKFGYSLHLQLQVEQASSSKLTTKKQLLHIQGQL